MGKEGVLYCRCANSGILPHKKRETLDQKIRSSGISVTIVDDLCGLCAGANKGKAEMMSEFPEIIIACRPRAVRNLFLTACSNPETLNDKTYFDLRAAEPAEILSALPKPYDNTAVTIVERPGEGSPEWPPWYPVIDEERCIRCGKCRDYCLFGVYSTKEDGRISVESPQSCKNLCPACARICPTGAVIFPKHTEAPFDGSPVSDDYKPEQPEEVQTEILRRRILNRKRKRELLKERQS